MKLGMMSNCFAALKKSISLDLVFMLKIEKNSIIVFFTTTYFVIVENELKKYCYLRLNN